MLQQGQVIYFSYSVNGQFDVNPPLGLGTKPQPQLGVS